VSRFWVIKSTTKAFEFWIQRDCWRF